MNGIDLTKQDITPLDPYINNDGTTVDFAWEMWMDIYSYLGIDKAYYNKKYGESNWWVNFYTLYNKETGSITASYTIDNWGNPVYHDWNLTEDEERFIRKKLDEFCKEDNGLNLVEWLENEVKEMEI